MPALSQSWMAPEAAKQQLLYVSTPDGEVSVWSYPYYKELGTVTGFQAPEGLCVDAAGDVFVTETEGQDVREYAHGSLTPKATLKDPGYTPVSCAVDPTTGNLAVANSGPFTGSGPGNVAFYEGAAGNPSAYYSDRTYITCSSWDTTVREIFL